MPFYIRGCHSPSENRDFPEMVKDGKGWGSQWVLFCGGGAMIALLDDCGQSQGNCGVWSNFSLPEFTN